MANLYLRINALCQRSIKLPRLDSEALPMPSQCLALIFLFQCSLPAFSSIFIHVHIQVEKNVKRLKLDSQDIIELLIPQFIHVNPCGASSFSPYVIQNASTKHQCNPCWDVIYEFCPTISLFFWLKKIRLFLILIAVFLLFIYSWDIRDFATA